MNLNRGFSQKIDNRFSLGITNNTPEDVDKIISLNVKIFGEPIKNYLEKLFFEHPKKDEILCLYIKDNNSNQIVSNLSLLPQKWEIEGLTFPICEMGVVGTLKEYRGNNLIQIINQFYEKAMEERGYLFSVIRGIHFFYRKLNYEYAFPLDDRIFLPKNRIPTKSLKALKIRKAKLTDLAFIKEKYYEFHREYYVINKFNDESFIYKRLNDNYDENALSTYILEENEKSVGYFSIGYSYDRTGYAIFSSKLSSQQTIKLLQFVSIINNDKEQTLLNLNVNIDTFLGKSIISLGGNYRRYYAWQIRIPDLKLFFEAFKPILEKRIENSELKGLTRTVIISSFSENMNLKVKNGKITNIEIIKGYPEINACDVCIPKNFLLKLLLSDRTTDEINYIVQDAFVNPESKVLVETLFPKKISFPDSDY